jgi:hypothetical protein
METKEGREMPHIFIVRTRFFPSGCLAASAFSFVSYLRQSLGEIGGNRISVALARPGRLGTD